MTPLEMLETSKMANGTPNEEKKKKQGLISRLPIPFVKGQPADIQKMNVENLRRFINFACSCCEEVDLPNSANPSIQTPLWWPTAITFDKSLKLRRGLKSREHQKHLALLVWKLYESYGFASLLAVSAELSDSRSKRFTLDKGPINWKVVDAIGRTIAVVDQRTRAYDANPRVVLEPIPNLNSVKEILQTKQVKKVLPKRNSKVKRALFESENEDELNNCKFCLKHFTYREFCEDHEKVCPKGPPKSEPSQESFLSSLGLHGISRRKEESDNANSDEVAPPAIHIGRTLRKLPKRNQLLSLIRNNPIPITSGPGKRFLSELAEKVEISYPPAYEICCKPKSGMGMSEPKFATVTKRTILKDGENPHVYSQGKLQRTKRYQELVVGLSESSWPAFNKCKRARLCLEKVDCTTKKIKVKECVATTSYLQRRFNAALSPQVKLFDIMKFPLSKGSWGSAAPLKLPKEIEMVQTDTISAAY
ncbi:hypothetical protein Ocin01_14502 [Orchesella cincta]|uniref:Nuclear respiratory factor 1 n=1 Tax=Orchesella cincta TaxID=48709 RepID=A0A1D2MGR8_ORCCI|nr:hypothetical protein Ocin01_14502 [Orchesella cincta]